MLEYEKYQELQAKSQRMQEDYERQLQEADEGKEQALEELTEYYENKLQEKSSQLEQVSYSVFFIQVLSSQLSPAVEWLCLASALLLQMLSHIL